MPPPRPPRNTTPFRSPNKALSDQTGIVGVASSLIGGAASAFPLFKPGGAGMGGGTRSLIDGAPSKQFGAVGLGRSASTHSVLSVPPGDGSGARTSIPLSRGKGALQEPRDAAARARYEDLFSSLVSQQRIQRRQTKAKEGEGDSSNASTVRGGSSSKFEERSGAVSALRGWFESDSHPSSNPTTDDFTMAGPTDYFEIIYPNLGGVGLIYENLDNNTGCKDIALKTGKSAPWRIWVSDEDGDGKNIDTLNYKSTFKRFCSKWIHIHISRSIWNA
ncbi:hypothetical protein NDA18_006559 [Ustilago nuda]|nr:hypothetical protein NDA18_006559 [Ustilago nuda]